MRIKRPNREHFITEFTADTFAFLANLLQFNLDSRRFVVDAMTGGLYGPLERREGQFEGIEPLARQRLLSLITLAILSTVYMALEDLGKILRLHKEPLREFPNRFVRLTQESSLSAFQELSTVPERSLLNVFPLWKPEWYGIGGQEATALNDYNIRVARITKQFLAFLADADHARGVVVHCYAGQGRTGTMLACALVHQGMSAEEAIRLVRAMRPPSIDTLVQEQIIFDFAALRENVTSHVQGDLHG